MVLLGNFLLLIIVFIGFLFCGLSWYMQYLPVLFNSTPATQDWWRNGLLNVGTGMITSVVVVFLYNRVLEKREMDRRYKRRLVAVEQLGGSIFRLVLILYELKKGTALEQTNKQIKSFNDIFDTAFFNDVITFDATCDWGKITANTLVDMLLDLDQTMDKIIKDYADCMDQEMLPLLDNMTTSEFIKYVREFPAKKRNLKESLFFSDFPPLFYFRGIINGPGGFKAFMMNLIELIRITNKDSTTKILPDVSFWQTTIPIGALRDNSSS